MFKKLQTILKKTIKKEDKEFAQYITIQKRWEKRISIKIKKNAEIIDFTDKTLTIKAKNGAWKNELIFMEEGLKKNFQTKQQQ